MSFKDKLTSLLEKMDTNETSIPTVKQLFRKIEKSNVPAVKLVADAIEALDEIDVDVDFSGVIDAAEGLSTALCECFTEAIDEIDEEDLVGKKKRDVRTKLIRFVRVMKKNPEFLWFIIAECAPEKISQLDIEKVAGKPAEDDEDDEDEDESTDDTKKKK